MPIVPIRCISNLVKIRAVLAGGMVKRLGHGSGSIRIREGFVTFYFAAAWPAEGWKHAIDCNYTWTDMYQIPTACNEYKDVW